MKIRKAMAMAAGRGSRMMPLTADRCKALVEVGDKALIDWTLDKFAAEGVEQAVINVHHFADALEAHTSQRRDIKVLISDERNELLETGGGLVKAAPLLGDEPILVSNIDAVWVDGDQSEMGRLAEAFDPERMDFLLALSPMGHNLGFDGVGDFYLNDDGRIERRGSRDRAPFAYAGFQILHPRVLKAQAIRPFSTNELWNTALGKGRIFGHPMKAFWMHVGDPKARELAENRLR